MRRDDFEIGKNPFTEENTFYKGIQGRCVLMGGGGETIVIKQL